MQRIACAQINLSALRHNLRQVSLFAPASKIMCVIKADAYGHGMQEVARTLLQAGADAFAVACVDEALLLREWGINLPITVFQGFQDSTALKACLEHQLWPVVHHVHQVDILESAALAQPLDIWLKASTGMNRLGFEASRLRHLWQRVTAINGIGKVRLMTHMACADEGASAQQADTTASQIKCFDDNAKGLKAEHSLANSATLIGWPNACREWVRPGIMLYGASPFAYNIDPQISIDLKPVMNLSSRLIAINAVSKGQAIGYGGTWVCPQDMQIGVIAIGYGDGYPRHISADTPALIRGRCCRIVGRVSMDLLTVDLSDSEAVIGDPVLLWGEGLPVDRIAQHAATIGYELLCGVSGHVRYQYTETI